MDFSSINGERKKEKRKEVKKVRKKVIRVMDYDDSHFNPPHTSGSESRWEAVQLTRSRRNHSPSSVTPPIDVTRSRFPFAIVWCPLPGITFFCPVIGHTGICDSRGVVMDFAGPYTIGVDRMSFSRPYLYLTLDPSLAANRDPGQSASSAWDAGVDSGCEEYSGRMHNICCDNCHSHVARVLNDMKYMGRSDWSMVGVGALVILKGKWVSASHALCVWVPFFCVITAILVYTLIGANKKL